MRALALLYLDCDVPVMNLTIVISTESLVLILLLLRAFHLI
jgi:hypothetical protein